MAKSSELGAFYVKCKAQGEAFFQWQSNSAGCSSGARIYTLPQDSKSSVSRRFLKTMTTCLCSPQRHVAKWQFLCLWSNCQQSLTQSFCPVIIHVSLPASPPTPSQVTHVPKIQVCRIWTDFRGGTRNLSFKAASCNRATNFAPLLTGHFLLLS